MVSDDIPQPAAPEPDPFEELLLGLSQPSEAEAAAPSAGEAETAPEAAAVVAPDAAPEAATEAMEYGHGPSEPPPTAPTVAFPGAAGAPPTVAAPMAGAGATEIPAPIPAQQPPSQSAPGWSLGDGTGETAMYPAAGVAGVAAGTAAAAPTAATTVLPGGMGGPPPSGPTGPTGTGGPFRNRKVLLWVLIGVAALLVIALAVLITVLSMNANGNEPTPTSTPTATTTTTPRPTSTRTPTPTPTVTPAIKSFVADPMVVQCADASAVASVSLGWSTVGATQVAVASAAGLTDAIDNPYQNNLGPTVESFSIPYACGNASWAYTLTIAGPDREHRSQVVTVTRLPFPSPTPPPPPPTPAPTISDFSASPASVTCVDPNSSEPFALNWTSSNGTSASIEGPGSNDWPSLQPNGTQPNIAFDCTQETMTFTLTVTGATAPAATKDYTVVNDGWIGTGG